jgi:two-component system phosphate regulon sensor histidine kinase PhoR
MKPTAFIIRIIICLLLALIPTREMENQVYRDRMEFRGTWIQHPDMLIVGPIARDRDIERTIQDLLDEDPRLVALAWAGDSILGVPTRGDSRVVQSMPTAHLRDPDGVARRYRVASVNLLGKALVALGRPAPQPLTRHLNYSGYPKETLLRCVDPKYGRCDLKGKIVVLEVEGRTEQRVSTPLGPMTEGEVFAQALSNELEGRDLRFPPHAVQIFLILALIILSARLVVRASVGPSAIAVAGGGFAVIIVGYQLLFRYFDLYVPSINSTLALLVSYLTFTGYRLAVQENLQWKSLKKSQYLREVEEMKSNFLALISHDVKTPIAKIQTALGRLQRTENSDPKVEAQLELIERSTLELKNYLNSIIDLSRIESRKVTLKKRPHDLNRAIRATIERLESIAKQKQLKIKTDLEPMFPFDFDRPLIEQVLTNLIDNAIRYSPEGATVEVCSSEDDGVASVRVRDQGPGIPSDQLPLMFRKFSRAHLTPPKGQPKGTGLGLYLSKYFINRHGGKIRFDTSADGTMFTFTLPIDSAPTSTGLIIDSQISEQSKSSSGLA